MSRQFYAESGTAGALAVITVLLVGMANVPTGTLELPSLDTLDSNAIYVERNEVFQGEIVNFYLEPILQDFGIQHILWDFHDTSSPIVLVPDENGTSIEHSFNFEGNFLVSLIAFGPGGITAIDTVEIIVQNTNPSALIQVEMSADEDEEVTLDAIDIVETLNDIENLNFYWFNRH